MNGSAPVTSGRPESPAAPQAGAATARARVLFVDDELHLLAGLRRMLRGERHRWDMEFVSSGAEALAVLAERPVDAVVSDMRMPGMDGAQLLAAVRGLQPATVRIVLSGQADRESVLAVSRCAQQFLAKPCDAATLTGAVSRALEVRRLLDDPALRELIGGVDSLPVLPTVYQELVEAMDTPDVDVAAVGRILASDVATSADVLRLVNSAFFGLPREVSSVEAAVALLGLDNIQALVLAGSVFRMDDEPAVGVDDAAQLRNLALLRTVIGRAIAAADGRPADQTAAIVLACMLRDVGTLVLAGGRPAAAAELSAALAAEPAPVSPARRAELEAAAYGCTVPQASAYLLGLWSFTPAAVHTIATQPLLRPEPGTSLPELILEFAHRRALRPAEHVPALTPDDDARAEAWNAAVDKVFP